MQLQAEENQQHNQLELGHVVQLEDNMMEEQQDQQEQTAPCLPAPPVYKVLVSQVSQRLQLQLPPVENQLEANVAIPQVDGGVTPSKLTDNTHNFEESGTTAEANITAGTKVLKWG